MVTSEPAGNGETAPVEVDDNDLEIFLSSAFLGCAVIDTGCTPSVIGEKTAEDLVVYLSSRGAQGPESLVLPPVQLRGFNGARTTSRQGLKWLVKIGDLWRHITTYVIPGATPFLLSRKVLQGMEADSDEPETWDQGMEPSFRRSPRDALWLHRPMRRRRQLQSPLRRQLGGDGPVQVSSVPKPPEYPKYPKALRHAFESIMKRTCKCQVDVEALQSELMTLFGCKVESAFCAYSPKFERVPETAHTKATSRCVASLSPAGALSITDWQERLAGSGASRSRVPAPAFLLTAGPVRMSLVRKSHKAAVTTISQC